MSYLEMKSERHEERHQDKVQHTDWHEVLPFQRKDLVNTQAGEGPTHPHEEEHHKEGLTNKPYGTGDEVHHIVETVETGNVEGRPTAEEHQGGNTCADEEVEVFRKVVITEVHT